MTKEIFEKIYTQFIDGTSLVNHVNMFDKCICIFDKFSCCTIDYKEISALNVNRYYYNNNSSEYKVYLEITLLNDCKYSIELMSSL